jgi:hypothetical protein
VNSPLSYASHERVSLKTHSQFNEAWLHAQIKADPSIIGLGDVRMLDHERRHSGAGRLDLLLYSEDDNRRFEVEVMLGATDPSHIIRTIEYWDIERRRYPGYEHVAVLIAEDITSRFLNVLSLMSGSIPFIAIQLCALQVGDQIVLNFVRVLDQTELRIDDTVEESGGGQVDRSFWETYAGADVIGVCDELLGIINSKADTHRQMNFLEQYIGLLGNGVVDNFIFFHPRKRNKLVHVTFRTITAAQLHDDFEAANLPSRLEGQKYVRVSLTPAALSANRDLIENAIEQTVKENNA